jgi:hypothetical protein
MFRRNSRREKCRVINCTKEAIEEHHITYYPEAIKNNNFEKLDNNTLSNKIYNEEKLEVELKKKFLIELKHESWLSFIQEINKIKGSNSK